MNRLEVVFLFVRLADVCGRFELFEHDTNPFRGCTAAGLALKQNCMP